MPVPNLHPTSPAGKYRLAIVGDAPDSNAEQAGLPFAGAAGQLIFNLLRSAGLGSEQVFQGNICQHKPPGNRLSAWKWEDERIQSGLQQLIIDLQQFKPNVILLLGEAALRAGKGQAESLSNWRGSWFVSPTFRCKCVASYSPQQIFRQYSWLTLLNFDIKRAVAGATDPQVPPTNMLLESDLQFDQIIDKMRHLRSQKRSCSADIEGGVYDGGMTCISFTLNDKHGFIVPFAHGKSLWSVEQEKELWRELAATLQSPNLNFCFQNGLYDLFILMYSHKLLVHNFTDDIMLKHWELYSELEKNLGLQTSIYTTIPYYKSDRKKPDMQTHFQYCIKDSIATERINNYLEGVLKQRQPNYEHYRFNIQMLKPLLYMSLRGFRLDPDRWNETRKIQIQKVKEKQELLESTIGMALNVKSWKQKETFLYKKLNLKKPKAKSASATDELTILKLARKHPDIDELYLLLDCIRARTRLSDIQKLVVDTDGRIRCSYNLVGTETGRLSSRSSPIPSPTSPPPGFVDDNSMVYNGKGEVGTNLQNVTEALRNCFVPDPGFYIWQCDLSGADTWTVAAHSARLGDDTLLKDLQAGLKPAKILMVAMDLGNHVIGWNQDQLLVECNKLKIPKDPTERLFKVYAAAKATIHGSNYNMGPKLMSDTIFIRSKGEIFVQQQLCQHLQTLYFQRYPGVKFWLRYIEQELVQKGKLTGAAGHTRIFFGRRRDQSTLRQALSDEPQQNTTYVTNLALRNMYYAEWNRRSDFPVFHVEPLHTVHDSAVGQFRIDSAEENVGLIKRAFDNPITIAGQTITIPYDGGYGPSWGELIYDI